MDPNYDDYEDDYGYDYEHDEFEGDEERYIPEYDAASDEYLDEGAIRFADPFGNSALRAATPSNPRNLPCPTCKAPNRLTPADVANHYQCNVCADRDEMVY